jgi:hypothetical protein
MRLTTVFAAILLLSVNALAGVSLDLVRTDAQGTETERTHISSQGGMLRIDSDGGPFSSDVSMIFLGDRFLVVDHDEKSYIVMDEAMLTEVSAKMNEVMKQMEAQLAQMPPEQRAMAEQMMKSQMGALSDMESAPPPRVEAIGPGEWNGRSCTRYAVFDGSEKSQDVCAAALDQIEGSAEMMEAFMQMARFVQKLSESLPGPLAASMASNPGAVIEQINGFPIHSIDYSLGEPSGESRLESIEEEALDESLFSAPEGYRLEDPFAGR